MSKRLSFDIDADELDMFLEDVNDCLREMESGILHLEQQHDAETLNAVFRAAHSLKALAGAIGHQRMAELTHTVESLFDDMREGEVLPTQTVADDLLLVVDSLKSLRDEVTNRKQSDVAVAALVEKLELIRHTDMQPDKEDEQPNQSIQLTAEQEAEIRSLRDAGQTVLFIEVITVDGAFASAARLYQAGVAASDDGDILWQQPALSELGVEDRQLRLILATEKDGSALEAKLGKIQDIASVEIRPYSTEVVQRRKASPSSQKVANNTNGTQPNRDKMVRISVERLDTLMNLVGELVTGRTRLLQIEDMLNAQYSKDNHVNALSEMIPQFSHVIDQLQEEVMRARMVPIATLFNKFPRLVRDIARRTNKQVDLIMEGESTELDRSIMELIHDPMVHILRNAVGHGLETMEERQAAGKPDQGTIQLTAVPVEGQIVLTIIDDGRGIDPDKIRKKAIDRHIISEEDSKQFSDAEITDLVFLPNMSTAETVTDISGRGVGLDVVRSNIEALGGSVYVTSQVGQHTTFHLTLPLTLALVQTMLVTIYDTLYAIPVLSITTAMYVSEADLTSVKGKPAINWAEEVVPLVDLREQFAPKGQAAERSNELKPSIIVVTWGKIRVGLVVDQIIGQQEIVVKSLSPFLGRVAGLSGATILGDGRIALIIDIPNLINTALFERRTQQ